MGENSKIEWTDHTFNPWIGCAKVSVCCANCYAERDFDHRKGRVKWGLNGTRSMTSEANWHKPFAWNQQALAAGVRRRVFCASLADVFEDWQGPLLNVHGFEVRRCEYCDRLGYGDSCHHHREARTTVMATMQDLRTRLWNLIERTPGLDWLLLTKRPENISRMLPAWIPHYMAEAGTMNQEEIRENLWIGVSVENQAAADQRIPELLKIPAAVRFLSCEPLLGPLDLRDFVAWQCGDCAAAEERGIACGPCDDTGRVNRGIHWVIAGGESGPAARPSHPEWFRGLRDQCQAAAVPFFFKQWGEWGPSYNIELERARAAGKRIAATAPSEVMVRIGKKAAGCLLDGRDWKEFFR